MLLQSSPLGGTILETRRLAGEHNIELSSILKKQTKIAHQDKLMQRTYCAIWPGFVQCIDLQWRHTGCCLQQGYESDQWLFCGGMSECVPAGQPTV